MLCQVGKTALVATIDPIPKILTMRSVVNSMSAECLDVAERILDSFIYFFSDKVDRVDTVC